MTGDRLVDEKTARALLGGIGRTMFYELIGSGAIGVVHVGRRTMVPVSQIDAFIADGIEYVEGAPMITDPMAACDICGKTFQRVDQHKRMAHKESQ